MPDKYILAIDQSTQGTKGLIFDSQGRLVARCDRSHRQIIDQKGWVEHDPEEIFANTLAVVRDVVEAAGIEKEQLAAVGISNQRETAMAWTRDGGKPVYNAIVWQCARGEAICKGLEQAGKSGLVKERTGLNLSPYFSAAKLGWIMENVPAAKKEAGQGNLCCGTMDTWLVYRLTNGAVFQTDYSNASRTQLFDLTKLCWDTDICGMFGVDSRSLAQIADSNGEYGATDFGGYLPAAIPIRGVMGDSHGALFGQNCRVAGMAKATYGTGSSVMMNIGESPVFSDRGIVTSLAWGIDGTVNYVLEGNINYTGAVIGWLKKDLQLIADIAEARELPLQANPADKTYFIPAFTGIGAPYWDSEATGLFTGITRVTGKAEMVKAAVDCIGYQIADIVELMQQDSGMALEELRVDGGPTENRYLMQFQSDITGIAVQVPELQELSGMGAAYMAGIAAGVYDDNVFTQVSRDTYTARMETPERQRLRDGWKKAVGLALTHQG